MADEEKITWQKILERERLGGRASRFRMEEAQELDRMLRTTPGVKHAIEGFLAGERPKDPAFAINARWRNILYAGRGEDSTEKLQLGWFGLESSNSGYATQEKDFERCRSRRQSSGNMLFEEHDYALDGFLEGRQPWHPASPLTFRGVLIQPGLLNARGDEVGLDSRVLPPVELGELYCLPRDGAKFEEIIETLRERGVEVGDEDAYLAEYAEKAASRFNFSSPYRTFEYRRRSGFDERPSAASRLR